MAIPTNIAPPVLTGPGIEFALLVCTTGTWAGSPTSYTFRWRHSDVAETFAEVTLPGDATEMRLTVTSAQIGHEITCRVAATNADGTSGFAQAADPVPPTLPVTPPYPFPGRVVAYPRPVEVPEAERAAAFRAQCVACQRFRAVRWQALAGDPTAAAAVRAAWAPILPDPADGWDCPPVPVPARPSWADRVPGDVELPEYLKRGR